MKKTLVLFFVVVVLSSFGVAGAAATSSPPRVLPGSAFYFLKIVSEKVELLLTFSKAAKISKLGVVAAERLSEAQTLAEKNPKAAETALQRYTEAVGDATSLAVKNKDSESVQKSLEALKTNTLKHQEVLAGLEEKVPAEAKDAILNAESVSSEHIANVIEKLESSAAAEEYLNKVEEIQQVAREEQMSQAVQAERLTPAPMESTPSENPELSVPRELKSLNPLNQGLDLRLLNPLNPPQSGEGGGILPMPQAAPIEPQAPASQY